MFNALGAEENVEHSLDFFFFTYLAFSRLGEFELSVYGSCFLPRTLV
jgi:hypothetical protein